MVREEDYVVACFDLGHRLFEVVDASDEGGGRVDAGAEEIVTEGVVVKGTGTESCVGCFEGVF